MAKRKSAKTADFIIFKETDYNGTEFLDSFTGTLDAAKDYANDYVGTDEDESVKVAEVVAIGKRDGVSWTA